MLRQKDIDEFSEYLKSGRWEEDFGYRTPDGQAEMLDLIESIWNLAELADEVTSRRFYKQMQGDAVGTAESQAGERDGP